MTPNTTRNWLMALLALSLAACTAETLEPGTEVGRLEMPLVSSSANGTQFMLEATFDLNGPESMSAAVHPADPNWGDDTLVLNPRVGSYMLAISNWRIWQLGVDPATGAVTSTPINTATLLSAAVQSVTILNNQTTSVVYQFSVPGSGVINFARGTLNIDFSVQQGLPDGSACNSAIECASFVCAADGSCAPASCGDGVQNGAETSPDCGGGCACGGSVDCATCPPGTMCVTYADGTTQCEGTVDCATCPAGTMCMTYADGTVQCVSGSSCNAAQAAACPEPALCTLDAAGFPVCGSSGSGCTAAEAAQCADPAQCTHDATGMVVCGGGSSGCTAAEAAQCADPAQCTHDATGMVVCGGYTSCNAAQAATCATAFCLVDATGMVLCSPPATP